MKPLIHFLGVIAVVLFLAWLFVFFVGNIAVDRMVERDCMIWQERAGKYDLFYLSKDRQDECAERGYEINAPYAPRNYEQINR